jgi:hypothetical protein
MGVWVCFSKARGTTKLRKITDKFCPRNKFVTFHKKIFGWPKFLIGSQLSAEN